MPTLEILKQHIDPDDLKSLSTYQNMLQENHFAYPSWWHKPKQAIRQRMKHLQKPPQYP